MKRELTVLAVMLNAVALFLPTRSQTFTRVAIDGHTMRMLVAGSGESTVVFENGLGPPLEMWGKVQPQVSRFARTVTYDRAGVGLSEDAPPPRDGRQIAAELRHALRVASVPPPYVLVGASLGGLYIRVFAGMYPDDVSGMVLVDPTHDAEGLSVRLCRRSMSCRRRSNKRGRAKFRLAFRWFLSTRSAPARCRLRPAPFDSCARSSDQKSTANRALTSAGWIPFPVLVS
ncbi:MAG: alpha/beta fold hydrolase [Luteitalea sp.]|nr:alpha/beta fold hydrolase [Luteitalea sp.]